MKLKSVTIMHSSTTETVRLPPEGGEGAGQVTVHPAVRSKLPLKRKVRVRNKKRGKDISINNNDSPLKHKRIPKKKKRVSAPVGAEEATKTTSEAIIEVPPSKVKKSPKHVVANRKKSKKKKEIIDYSKTQLDRDGTNNLLNTDINGVLLTADTDPVGKVQSWLLRSQQSSSVLPKSKSTPAGLTSRTSRSPHKIRPTVRTRPDKSKALSVGNIPGEKDKLRLQVVYKPPFKFSLKLRKPDKTSAVVEKSSNQQAAVTKRLSGDGATRTGVLVRTVPNRDRKSRSDNKHSKRTNKTSKNIVPPLACTTSPTSPTSANVNSSASQPAATSAAVIAATANIIPATAPADDIDSNIHTVQSDLEVLLSESEFLFSDN